MIKKSLAVAISSAVGLSVLGFSQTILADENTENNAAPIEEVVITGSSIKRDLDGALPVQIISKVEIERSGVGSVGELVQSLPAMQGFTTTADSVGGSGGGIVTANLRDLGDQYTLVLLNGRRMAPADSGSSIDLSNIPLSAVERVEVLTDGASALYGSDAIAGVVNFILKDSVEGTSISARMDTPQEQGGESWSFDVTTGFGDIDMDGYSVVLSYSHHRQDQLASKDRDFAKSGIITFDHPSYTQQMYFFNGSGNAIPGNARVKYIDGDGVEQTRVFNPYSAANGDCAENTSPIGDECWFDYTSTIEIIPESDRDSFFANARFRFSDNLEGFFTGAYSTYDMTTRIAPYPTGWVRLPNDSDLVMNEVLPHLTDEELAGLTSVDGRWRALPASNRTTEWLSNSLNLTFGLEGNFGDIDYSGAVTHSVNDRDQRYPTGWLLREPFQEAVSNGDFNIFAHPGDFTDADMAALAPTIYSGDWDNEKITVSAIDGKASMPVFEMNGGEAQVAVGFDYRTTRYDRTISESNANEELLFLSKDTPYDMERSQWGMFAEMLLPVTDTLEVTLATRFDEIGAVKDKINGGDINESDSDLTYKVSALWNVTDYMSLRASYGTGFKAPSMREIGEPLSEFGVTSGNFACPFPAGDPLAEFCLSGESQYNVFRQGYAGLKSETSTQYSFGAVFTASSGFSATIDYWNIEMKDLVERLEEAQIFANPQQYRDLFTTKPNLSTSEDELAIIQAAVNVGSSSNSGIDYNFRKSYELSFGELSTSLSGTHFLESESSLTGSSLGRFGADAAVTFRDIIKLNAVLDHGNFTHSVSLNYRSGYSDQLQWVTLLESDGSFGDDIQVQMQVPSYTTIDYQTQYRMMDDSLVLAFGINNLGDKEPPLSLRTEGAGHQVGWDPRYVDPYGRTLYFKADYSF